MKRRTLLAGFAGMITAPFLPAAGAADNPAFGAIGPFKEDARAVYEFFSFGCTFCQQHHGMLLAWGRSIPRPAHFEPVPVVVDFQTFNAARAFYSVQRATPAAIDGYSLAVLDAFRRGDADPASRDVLARSGVDSRAFDAAWRSPAVKSAVQSAAELTLKYSISATPSIAIGGAIVLNADHVNGDYGMLARLASGFVSRILERA